ncbi:MAG: hypothetical protein IPM39_25075 [Chloroflexi bacterium]|nr:hypothetical protein [Chloroflexota bacterium]
MAHETNIQELETQTAEQVYSVKQLAQRYKVGTRTINRWIGAGLFPGASKKNPTTNNSPYEITQSGVDYYENLRKAAAKT